jgi:hypothetical protein
MSKASNPTLASSFFSRLEPAIAAACANDAEIDDAAVIIPLLLLPPPPPLPDDELPPPDDDDRAAIFQTNVKKVQQQKTQLV